MVFYLFFLRLLAFPTGPSFQHSEHSGRNLPSAIWPRSSPEPAENITRRVDTRYNSQPARHSLSQAFHEKNGRRPLIGPDPSRYCALIGLDWCSLLHLITFIIFVSSIIKLSCNNKFLTEIYMSLQHINLKTCILVSSSVVDKNCF